MSRSEAADRPWKCVMSAPSTQSSPPSAPVRALPWNGTDEELVARLRAGGAGAAAVLFDRFGDDVNRLVWRTLGADADHDDLVQQTFLEILKNVHKVRDPSRLRSWVVSVTLNTVRSEIRKRRFRRPFFADAPAEHDFGHLGEDHEAHELLSQTYAILDRLPANERIAFVLRYIEGYKLTEGAEACGCSLATFKRRLARAERTFSHHASKVPALADRMRQSKRWRKHVSP